MNMGLSMRDIDHALENIKEIRDQIAVNRMFRGFGPAILALTGLLGIVIAMLQVARPDLFADTPVMLLGVWVLTAIVCVIFIGIEMFARSRRHHGALADSMITNVIEKFLPVGAIGAVIWAVLIFNAPETVWILPGVWQMLVAVGIFTSLSYLPKRVIIVAAWYFIAGTGVLILASIDKTLSPWFMGIPFLIGQLLLAGILKTTLEKKSVED